jgi:transcriptional regulator with XRE-family HTH domain
MQFRPEINRLWERIALCDMPNLEDLSSLVRMSTPILQARNEEFIPDGGRGHAPRSSMTITEKIAHLVAEKGWNQEDFARLAKLNRNTAREILLNPKKRLRNQTVRLCADALGIPVHELMASPVERLLQRKDGDTARTKHNPLEIATQPELQNWMERNPERSKALSADEVDELLSLQGTGGPMTAFGVDHFVEQIERKRKLKEKVDAIAGTEYLPLLEQFVTLVYEKIQPYPDR